MQRSTSRNLINDICIPGMSVRLDISLEQEANLDAVASSMDAGCGVLAISDDADNTILLQSTANLRLLAGKRLNEVASAAMSHTRSIVVEALTAGSLFEADWAYLQHARTRLPDSYRSAVDRWQAWFLHCDVSAKHPQWTKTAHPTLSQAGESIGPIANKHAAGRMIEVLQDAFDLCRYHHLLVQAPHALACAYKEMGRCPAPCDGTIGMDEYRTQMTAAMQFAQDVQRSIENWESELAEASRSLEFEAAQRLQTLLDRTKPLRRVEFSQVGRLADFKRLAVLPSEKRGWVRLFLIAGGNIQPWLDMSSKVSEDDLTDLCAAASAALSGCQSDFSLIGLENLGLVCWHMFQPRAQRRAEFLRLIELVDTRALLRSVRRIGKPAHKSPTATTSSPPEVDE